MKLYAWEESFLAKVFNIREKELKKLKHGKYVIAALSFSFQCAPFLVSKSDNFWQRKISLSEVKELLKFFNNLFYGFVTPLLALTKFTVDVFSFPPS